METFYMKSDDGQVFETTYPENWKGCIPVSAKEGKALIKQNAIQSLKNILTNGDTVYTVLRYVSPSGSTRRIDLYTFKDNKKIYLTGYFAMAKGEKPPQDGYKIIGGGMDMGFQLVYLLEHITGLSLVHEWI